MNDTMMIRNPETNEWESVYLPPTGDTYPIGAYAFIAGEKAPTGWLRADGQAVSRTEYADLFNVIGTTYGVGDGSTTFNLPNVNLENRTLVGSSGDGEFALGNTTGEKEHTLTVNEMPSHKPSILLNTNDSNITGSAVNYQATSKGRFYSADMFQNIGGGASHNNMQPSIAAICIIKAKQSVGLVGTITDNINDQNDNAVVNAKTVKEYVDNTVQIIYCKKKADYTTSETYKQIDDWVELNKIGNELSLEAGKVVIGKNIHNIKIINKMRITGKDGEVIFSYLTKNGSNIQESWFIQSIGGTDITFINETIVDVSEGDIITSSIYGGGSKVNSDASTFIVEKIN